MINPSIRGRKFEPRSTLFRAFYLHLLDTNTKLFVNRQLSPLPFLKGSLSLDTWLERELGSLPPSEFHRFKHFVRIASLIDSLNQSSPAIKFALASLRASGFAEDLLVSRTLSTNLTSYARALKQAAETRLGFESFADLDEDLESFRRYATAQVVKLMKANPGQIESGLTIISALRDLDNLSHTLVDLLAPFPVAV